MRPSSHASARGGAGAREARKAALGGQATGPNCDMKAPADTGTLLPPGQPPLWALQTARAMRNTRQTDHLVLHASTEGRRDFPTNT
jgi:hypothetical protein